MPVSDPRAEVADDRHHHRHHEDQDDDHHERVSALLAEFRSVDDDAKTFFSTLANNQDMQRDLFGVFSSHESDDIVIATLDLLLEWRRHLNKQPHLVLQYLPVILSYSMMLRRRIGVDGVGRRLAQALEAFLLTIHNQEVEKMSTKSAAEQTFFVANLSQSSAFHDGARLAVEVGGDEQERGVTMARLPQFKKTGSLNLNLRGSGAANRQAVAESNYRLFNSGLGDYTKLALEEFVKSTQRMLQHEPRINLAVSILLELLHGAYFCVYNGFHAGGGQVVELVRQRALLVASPQLLLSVNAVRTLILTAGPTQAPDAATISTPNRIAKNLITNASFRAKKISDDIAKVQKQELTVPKDDPMSSNLKVLASMSAIDEDVVEDLLTTGVAAERAQVKVSLSHHGWENKLTPRDKLKVKLSNPVIGFKKKSSSDENDKSSKGDKKQEKRKEKRDKDESGLEMKQLAKAVDAGPRSSRKKDRQGSANRGPTSPLPTVATTMASDAGGESSGDSAAALLAPPDGGRAAAVAYQNPRLTISDASSSPNLVTSSEASRAKPDSIKQVEALIQGAGLPAETITIHSPESGTTLF